MPVGGWRVNANGSGGDPTVPRPPKIASDGPAPAYAVIHTSHHIPKHTPLHPETPTPRGYIYFLRLNHERSFCV